MICFVLFTGMCTEKRKITPIQSTESAELVRADTNLNGHPIVYIEGDEPFVATDHHLLNTVEWQLRQPIDLSTSEVVTVAKSDAEEVHFTYECEGVVDSTRVIPRAGEVKDIYKTDCETEITTYIIATGDHVRVEYKYTIDIAFLNKLGI